MIKSVFFSQIDNVHLSKIDMVYLCQHLYSEWQWPPSLSPSLFMNSMESVCSFLHHTLMSNVTSCKNIESPSYIRFLNLTYYIEQ